MLLTWSVRSGGHCGQNTDDRKGPTVAKDEMFDEPIEAGPMDRVEIGGGGVKVNGEVVPGRVDENGTRHYGPINAKGGTVVIG